MLKIGGVTPTRADISLGLAISDLQREFSRVKLQGSSIRRLTTVLKPEPTKQKKQHVPLKLLRFFEKYPPVLYSAKYTGITIAVPFTRHEAKLKRIAEAEAAQTARLEQQRAKNAAKTTASPTTDTSTSTPTSTATQTASTQSSTQKRTFPPNPFLPWQHPISLRWYAPRISLRKQADLVKLAKRCSIEYLLPPGRKSTAFKQARIVQRGSRVKGTGVGQEVKGHIFERRMGEKLKRRKEALADMPRLVREWERRGHGRGWKDWPKAKTK
jgi:large subunit ribosomal protein L25